jgi:hypothetical protein
MKRPPKRPALSVCALESRNLPSGGPGGTWIGQDGHDLAGPSSTLGPSDIQDIHIALSGLTAARTVAFAAVQPLGGGEWDYNGTAGNWAAALVETTGTTTADLYVEPSQTETGRPFHFSLRYDDGSTVAFWVAGGPADPALHMPHPILSAAWIGQDGHDYVGPGPSVGPDGVQDVHVVLPGMEPGLTPLSTKVNGAPGEVWSSGLNPSGDWGAELVVRPGDPTTADLYFNPTRNLAGQNLMIAVAYAGGRLDTYTVVAGPTDTALRVAPAPPLPTFRDGLSGQWLGQDGSSVIGPHDVHASLGGLPAGLAVVAAELTDQANSAWVFNTGVAFYGDSFSTPLGFVRADNSSTFADIYFPPMRDESASTLMLRLAFADGSSALTQFAGGSADVGLRSPVRPSTATVAHPGDDLNLLANQFGAVHLSAGEYDLAAPLVLNQPVAISADAGTALVFHQDAAAAPWTTAIKIHAGNTTLDGFAVRFDGPVQWDWSVSYGPAVIGSTDDHDVGHSLMKSAITLSHLDLQSPPASTSWEQAPNLIRLVTAVGGHIQSNILKGGTTVVMNGPWWITDNSYQGTVPGTYTYEAFAGHSTHDVTLQNNLAEPIGPAGKTWRFLVLTDRGAGDLIAGNTVIGIGPRDDDTVTGANAAEIILTEAYHLHFEGMPLAVSADGWIVQIPPPQGDAARTGDVVAILSGSAAGGWRRIAQAIDERTYVLDSPLPVGSSAISIATGFVDETFRANTIDSRGSSIAGNLILVGNHFGTQVVDNHFLGGADAFKFTAAPTEHPDIWGWSHAPALGVTIDGNVLDDVRNGATISVEHSAAIKTNAGRTYFSGMLTNTTIGWSDAFLAAHPNPPGLRIGDPGSLDPGELVIGFAGNHVRTTAGAPPGGTLLINAGTVNGQAWVSQEGALPAGGPGAPGHLLLVDDSGLSPYDAVTNDGRVRFDAVASAAGYEYRLAGSLTYTNLGNTTTVLPAGLVEGSNTVFVRAYDALGVRGPDTSLTFVLDTSPPETSAPVLEPASDTGWSTTDPDTRVTSPRFTFSADATDSVELLRDGTVIGNRVGPGSLGDAGVPHDGTYVYTLRRTDVASNTSVSDLTTVTIDTTPPGPVVGLSAAPDGHVQFQPPEPGDQFAYSVGAAGPFQPLGSSTGFTPVGLVAGDNTVVVHAIDAAGNQGPDSAILVLVGAGAVSGTWLGQDGHDLVGAGPGAGPDGIQDIHVALAGLRADVAVASVDVEGLGGGRWVYNGAYGPWPAALVQAKGAPTADLYLDPYIRETGRPFWITVAYSDGSTASFWISGGSADPTLRVPAGMASPHPSKTARKTRAHPPRSVRGAPVKTTRQNPGHSNPSHS